MADPNDDVQVHIHGAYGRGPMPVEFQHALAEMVRLITQAIAEGTLPKRAAQQSRTADLEDRPTWACPHGHLACCGHHDLEDMPLHAVCPETGGSYG